MLIPTIIMAIIALVFFIIATRNGHGQNVAGMKIAFKLTIEVLPLLIFAFIIAGLVQTIIPKEIIAHWVGAESGFKGLFIGTLAGAITPGGPYVSLPIVAGLYKSGAGMGTMVAFVTSWSLWAIARLPLDVGILGWKFTLIRLLSVFFFPPLAGMLANFWSRFI